jgi:hypothetical protein
VDVASVVTADRGLVELPAVDRREHLRGQRDRADELLDLGPPGGAPLEVDDKGLDVHRAKPHRYVGGEDAERGIGSPCRSR